MPGKMGDLLFSMLIAREIARQYGLVDVVTSAYCEPVAPLLARLPYVGRVSVLTENDYRIEHTHFGAQPWRMKWATPEVADGMRHGMTDVYHLGFRHFPFPGQSVPELCGEPYGIKPSPGPWLSGVERDPAGPVAVHLGSRPDRLGWLLNFAQQQGRKIRLVGAAHEFRDVPGFSSFLHAIGQLVIVNGYDNIADALSGCSEFWGVNSGPSIVAMGAGLPVTWPHDPHNERARWAHHGCQVNTVDRHGTRRELRSA